MMKPIIVLAFAAALAATTAHAQTTSPPAGASSADPVSHRVVRKPTRVKKNPRYGSGTPVTATGQNGVRINSAGEVLYDEP